MGANISEVLEGYKTFLSRQYPHHFEKFKLIEADNLDGAKFEAACFSILQSRNFKIDIGEENKCGGADFICTGKTGKFALEATTIDTYAMERKTLMKNDQRGISAGIYCSYPTLYQKLEGKVKQLSKYQFPRIVAIGSFHNESLILLRNVLADEYLYAFLTAERYGKLIPNQALKDISAFILIGFGYGEYSIIGFINPAPVYHFNIQLLADISFRQITEKGLKGGTGEGKWVKSKNNADDLSFRHPLQLIH